MENRENKNLYAIGALFDSPNKLIALAKKLTDDGYRFWDVHSSYPLHGISKTMRLKWSPLGYVALVLGLTGTLVGLFLTYWTMSVDYRLTIGGKPWFSFPAFIPVLFELTVLLAAVGTAIVMLFILFKLPNNRHPLHDSEYLKKISVDRCGIIVEAHDAKFNYETIRGIFKEFGATEVLDISYDGKEVEFKPRVFEPKFMIFLIVVAVVTSAFGYLFNNKILYLPPFDFMLSQFKQNPQTASNFFADGFGMRSPVPGTVARGQRDYPFKGKPDEAGEKLVNPLLPTSNMLELGKKKYNTFCSPCHGWRGEGDSRLNGQFPNPPSLHSEKVRNWSDGRIYHVIVEGQNIMPSYASQLSERERWAIILYIRALQRSLNAKQEDVK